MVQCFVNYSLRYLNLKYSAPPVLDNTYSKGAVAKFYVDISGMCFSNEIEWYKNLLKNSKLTCVGYYVRSSMFRPCYHLIFFMKFKKKKRLHIFDKIRDNKYLACTVHLILVL